MKPGENKPPGRQTKLEASLFNSKLTSRDYKNYSASIATVQGVVGEE